MILWKKRDLGLHGDQPTGEHHPFWKRPGLSRREFFRIAGTGVAGYYLMPVSPVPDLLGQARVPTRNTARNCIFILLSGAPSHVDTFDLKEGPWTPAAFAPTSYNGIRFPQGLMPTLAEQISSDIAIVRSVRAWAVVHSLSQVWAQIGRNPTSGMGKIAPHIGSIVAIEKAKERAATDFMPAFVSLNAAGNQPSQGYLSSTYAPFNVVPQAGGLPDTTHPDGQNRFNTKLQLLNVLDGSARINSPYGGTANDLEGFTAAGRSLMYNQDVTTMFTLNAAERTRYGGTGFGDACMVARNLVEANRGTRFVQITLGGWDMHSAIYAANNLQTRCQQLDRGLGNLISDLKGAGLLDSTMIVMLGEFGRTVGPLNNQGGRDHFFQQFAMFAGGGVRGGRTVGATDNDGRITTDPGWSRARDVRVEDIEATILSAMGIDWTTIRYDDPFKRGFEYIPFSKDDIYGPVNEIWG